MSNPEEFFSSKVSPSELLKHVGETRVFNRDTTVKNITQELKKDPNDESPSCLDEKAANELKKATRRSRKQKESGELGGLRHDTGKLLAYLLPPEALIELTRIFTKGATKYSDQNWRKGMPWSKVIGPLDRHLMKFKMGQTEDKELRCRHAGMVAWNALTLLVYELQELGFDDRILPEKMTIDDDMNWVELTPAQKAAHSKHNKAVYARIEAEDLKKKKKKN